MRLAPVPMFYFPDRDKALHFSGESSRTTHGATECIDACRLFSEMLLRTFAGLNKQYVLFGSDPGVVVSPAIQAIARGEYRNKSINDIHGTGYVVNSLEAALWCFLVTESFDQAVFQAANLGDDADTTAAICGQIAGAFYGESGIPAHWLERLAMRDEIVEIVNALYAASH